MSAFADIIRDVAELEYEGGYDEVTMLAVTPTDLRRILERHLAAATSPGGPAQAIQGEPIKDHVLREVVNDLRDTAIKFHDAQQLRERLRRCLDPLLAAQSAPQQAAVPIAWKYRDVSSREWCVTLNERWAKCLNQPDVIPLIADPAADGEAS